MKAKKNKKLPSILERASHYLYVMNGEVKSLDEMTREELIRALINTIDVVEKLSGHVSNADVVLKRWSDTGKP